MNLHFLLRCCVTVLAFGVALSSHAASELPATQQHAWVLGARFESNKQHFQVVENLEASIDAAQAPQSTPNNLSPSAIVPHIQQPPSAQALKHSAHADQYVVVRKGEYAIRLRTLAANFSSTTPLAHQSANAHATELPVVQNMGTKILGIVTGTISFSYKQGQSSEAIALSHQLSLSYSLDEARLGFVRVPPDMNRILDVYRALKADTRVERVAIDIIENPLIPH